MATEQRVLDQSQIRREQIDRSKKWIRHLPAYFILVLWSLFIVFVVLWVIVASFKTNRELFTNVWSLPANIQFENYIKAWDLVKMKIYFLNSVKVVFASVVMILIISTPAAYVLSRKKFKGNSLITTIFIAGMGVPLPLLFIPLFVILTGIKQNNTLFGLGILFVSLSLSFTIYILYGFFRSLPDELEEAAIIDGANEFQVFIKVMLPLASPGLITAAIFNFIGLWNEYQLALIFLNSPDIRTLSLGLYAMQISLQYNGDWVGLMAGVVIVMIPTIILYIFLSEKMIAGITMGAVKG